MRICENEPKFIVGADNDELKGLTHEEAMEHTDEMRKNFEAKYVVYLGHQCFSINTRNP